MNTPDATHPEPADLRALAVTRLRKRHELHAHLLTYVLVNLFLTGIWLVASPGGFFWPMFPLLGWGIGLALHAWDVYSPDTPSEESIDREIARLQRH